MKRIMLMLTILVLAYSASLNAQSFPDPEFSSRPYILDTDNTLRNLERADAQLDIKIKGMGYGGAESYYTAFAPKSDVRFSKNGKSKLIIKVEGNVDPSEIVTVSKAVFKKDRRRFLIGNRSLTGKSRDVSSSFVKLDFKKIRDGIYEIILPNDIASGEYAFMPIGEQGGSSLKTQSHNIKISCFGID